MIGWVIVFIGFAFLMTARLKNLIRGSILVVLGVVAAVDDYNMALTVLVYVQLVFWLIALYGTTREAN